MTDNSSSSSSDEGLEIKPKKPLSELAKKTRLANLAKADKIKKELDLVKRVATKEKKLIVNKAKVVNNLKLKYEKLSGKTINPDIEPEVKTEPESDKIVVEVINHVKPVIKKVKPVKKIKPPPLEEIEPPKRERYVMIFA